MAYYAHEFERRSAVMGNQPEQLPEGADDLAPEPSALRDIRWLTGGIWLGLLVALLVTSAFAVTGGGLVASVSRFFSLPNVTTSGNEIGVVAKRSAVANAGMSALTALALLGAWLAFARVTRAVIVAFARASQEEPAATELLEVDDVEDEWESARTLVGNVLAFIAAAWVFVIVSPAVIATVQAFSAY